MSLEDPFFVVRDEVNKAVQTARDLYERWCALLDDPKNVSKEELDWTTNELKNSLRSIEWDLEDLEETISIVEKNPKKFKIEESELRERKGFVAQTRRTVQDMRDHLASPAANIKNESRTTRSIPNGPSRRQDKYTRLDNEIERSNQQFIDESSQQQQLIMRGQEDVLENIGTSVTVLKNMSHQIGNELDEQSVMLDDFSRDMDNTETKLDATMKKISQVLHMSNDRRQWIAIAVLVGILILVIILFIVL